LAHKSSCFLTLTYADEFLPEKGNLCKKDLQKFLKRLRYHLGKKFRYFAIGEYGSKTYRPHYHIILFGVEPFFKQTFARAWSKKKKQIGIVHIGELNAYSARYISGYTTQKVTKRHDKNILSKEKEFMISSRQNGAIGVKGLKIIADHIVNNRLPVGILRTIKIGKKETALGRYLTVKLAEMLDVPEEEFDREFWIHQEGIFKNFMKGEKYYENYLNWVEPRATRRAKRHLLYSKKREKI
jgi:hypothetical protein